MLTKVDDKTITQDNKKLNQTTKDGKENSKWNLQKEKRDLAK